MPTSIDFAELKTRVSIEQVVQFLGLKMTRSGPAFRGECPTCRSGGPRALVVTPSKGVFFCFAAKKGGDQLALAAHVRNTGVRQAAEELVSAFGTVPSNTSSGNSSPSPPKATKAPTEGLDGLDYLEADHPLADLLGVSALAMETLQAGYAPKGTMIGRYLIPLRMPDGTLVGYLGLATKEDQQPLLLFPRNLEERCLGTKVEAESSITGMAKPEPDQLRKMFRVVGE
jgi:hypothetical protein